MDVAPSGDNLRLRNRTAENELVLCVATSFIAALPDAPHYCVQAKFSRTLKDVNAAPLNLSPSAPTPKPLVRNSMIPRRPLVEGHVSGSVNAV